jgi:translation initiation factor 3 subunit C
MSRFFQGSDSDEDSSSSSDEEIYSEEDEEQSDQDFQMEDDDEGDETEEEEGSGDEDRGQDARKAFLRETVSDESDEDEGKRVVKSAKDKRLEEIEATSKAIENGGKINDWTVISNGMSMFFFADCLVQSLIS